MFSVQLLSKDAKIPTKGSPGSAGYDLYSARDEVVPAHGKALIKTDICIAFTEEIKPNIFVYGRIAPRSGLAVKNHIDVGAGVIDNDYRGPVGVVLFNHSDKDFKVSKGDRIAQLILELYISPEVKEVKELPNTKRGVGGFGSTGK